MKYEECSFDESFIKPLLLMNIPPAHLWYRGKLPHRPKAQKVVSIVGARRCTKYGEEIAYNLAYQLGKMGIIVVSGLAYGIDACAHRGCL